MEQYGLVSGITNGPRFALRSLGQRLPKFFALALLIATGALFAGCGAFGGDQNTFAPAGDVANKQFWYFQMALWPAIVILIGVLAACVYLLVRYRRRDDQEPLPKQLHGNQRLELAWTIAPAILLLGLAVPIVMGIVDLGRTPHADALNVTVHAYRFSWDFEYPEYTTTRGNPLVLRAVPDQTPQLHIPIDREVGVHLQSADVIHSFWVPKLAGKLDVMPGRNNRFWFNGTKLGTYSAQCAEFCGLNHAFMRFQVVVETQEQFDTWIEGALARQERDEEDKAQEEGATATAQAGEATATPSEEAATPEPTTVGS
jgi:cytochrome c oxidase subunit 2